MSAQLEVVQLLSAHLALQVSDDGIVPGLVGRHVGVDRADGPVVVLPAGGDSHGAGALHVGVGVAADVAGQHLLVGHVVVVHDVAVLAVGRRLLLAPGGVNSLVDVF